MNKRGSGKKSRNTATFPSLVLGSLLIGLCIFLPACASSEASKALGVPGEASSGKKALSQHYEVYAEGVDADDTARMLECFFQYATEFFGRSPTGKMRVNVFASRERYVQGLVRDGFPDPGGFYGQLQANMVVYLLLQRTPDVTREVILHEAVHQFYALAVPKKPGVVLPWWFSEGMSDYMAKRDWDGTRLREREVQLIALEEEPQFTRDWLMGPNMDLPAMVSGSKPFPSPGHWAMARFLAERYPDRFRDMRKLVEDGMKMEESWGLIMGGSPDEWVGEFMAYVRSQVQPWWVVSHAWRQKEGAIEAVADSAAILARQDKPDEMRVVISTGESKGSVGVIFDYSSPDDFSMIQFLPDGRMQIVSRKSGGKNRILVEPVRIGDQPRHRVHLIQGGGKVRVRVDGGVLGVYDTQGRFGLYAEGCKAKFNVSP